MNAGRTAEKGLCSQANGRAWGGSGVRWGGWSALPESVGSGNKPELRQVLSQSLQQGPWPSHRVSD